MRFVAVKSEQQQAAGLVFRTRDLLVRQQTQLINAIRGHLTEYGWVAPKGPSHVTMLADLSRKKRWLAVRLDRHPAAEERCRRGKVLYVVETHGALGTWTPPASVTCERDDMRSFRLTMLVTGAALSVSVASFAAHPVLAGTVESVPVETGNGDTVCRSDDIGSQHKPSAMSEGVCPEHAKESDETARARAYLIETATPGYTMTRQGPERAIGRLHPEFVRRLAAAIAEARAAGLPSAGLFSAYRPPAFGIGGFADKFHSLHTYGLAVDVTGIGAPGTPSALLWHEIAARNGVICPYGPHNPVEWNHCQPTWVKIILPDNPLRETVTADGPVSLEGMFEVGYSLIATSGIVGASTDDPPAHFFKPPQTRTAILVDPRSKTASKRTTPKDAVSALDAMRWPPVSVGKIGWPKGVPRIAKLDEETRRQGSRVANRPLSPKPTLISISRVLAEYSVGRSVIPSAHNKVERLRQPRANTKVPISAGLAKTCRALAIKAHPTQRAGSGTGSAQAQRDYFQDCVANRSQKLAKLS